MDETVMIVFSLLGRPVTLYALCVTLSAALGLLFCAFRCRHMRPGTTGVFATLALPLSLLGARVFYCLARLSYYQEIGFAHVLFLWEGGYALWGALGGAALAAFFTARITRQSVSILMDKIAPCGALVIFLCRLAEYTNGEGIGRLVENEALCRFPIALQNVYEEWYYAIFLLEALAALTILIALLCARIRRPGDGARLFLLLYSACQIVLESMRRDNYLCWLFVRVSQLTAVLVLFFLAVYGVLRRSRTPKARRMPGGMLALWCCLFVLCTGVCILLEFAIDKSATLPVWAGYAIMALMCVGFGVSTYQLCFRSVKE